jgi:release factor glutamine methyltransferase
MRITEILTTKQLPKSTTPRLDLELLLAAVLHQPRSFIYAYGEFELTLEQEKKFQKLYEKRLAGEPIAYILGKKEFWSLELTVSEKVLIPRPETELLVETILQLPLAMANIVDLGTGSGAIAIAIAKERPHWKITAIDISSDALQIAKINAAGLQIQNIEFCKSDWCETLPDKKFDIIVSNPPYIANNDLHLQRGDIRFEPKIALEAGDGLDAIRKIITQAKNKSKPGGLLALEHGYNQSNAVQELLQQNNYREITPIKDLANIYRIVVAKTGGTFTATNNQV